MELMCGRFARRVYLSQRCRAIYLVSGFTRYQSVTPSVLVYAVYRIFKAGPMKPNCFIIELEVNILCQWSVIYHASGQLAKLNKYFI
jgi:hypothetical protein